MKLELYLQATFSNFRAYIVHLVFSVLFTVAWIVDCYSVECP